MNEENSGLYSHPFAADGVVVDRRMVQYECQLISIHMMDTIRNGCEIIKFQIDKWVPAPCPDGWGRS